MDTLVPAFRARVEAVIKDMHAQGYDAIVHETRRTPERAEWLKSKGTSKNGARSMHCYDCAADVISQAKGWDPPQGFWDALGNVPRQATRASGERARAGRCARAQITR
jgi:hypothetical protein